LKGRIHEIFPLFINTQAVGSARWSAMKKGLSAKIPTASAIRSAADLCS